MSRIVTARERARDCLNGVGVGDTLLERIEIAICAAEVEAARNARREALDEVERIIVSDIQLATESGAGFAMLPLARIGTLVSQLKDAAQQLNEADLLPPLEQSAK